MTERIFGRRAALRLAGVLAATASASATYAQQATQVRWSTGTEPPKLQAPPNATDCHFHIYDASFPIAPYATLKPPEASVADYQNLRQRLGVTRGVLILPSTYGTDNRSYLALLPKLGSDRTRMVAVVNTS